MSEEMLLPFEKKIVKYSKAHRLLRMNQHVLIGFSGGVDSVALLYALHAISKIMEIKISLLHLHHGIREDADKDVQIVIAHGKALGYPVYVEYADVPNLAKKNGISEEMAAREERYKLFEKYKEEKDCHVVALAHHKDDQAETILGNILRGTGLKGLGGMKPMRDIYIRPLLELRKEELIAYVREKNLAFAEDSTNTNTKYRRNSIRHILIPMLEEKYNPNIVETLTRAGSIVREEEEYLQEVTEKVFNEICEKKENEIVFSIQKLKEQHVAVRYRLYRKAIEVLAGSLDGVVVDMMKRIDKLIDLQVGKVVELPFRLMASKGYEEIFLRKREEKHGNRIICENPFYTLDIDANKGYIQVAQYRFFYEFTKNDNIHEATTSNHYGNIVDIACFDMDFLREWIKEYGDENSKLVIRTRKIGDILHIHQNGSKKTLKKFFIDEKIPKEERDHLLLLTMDNVVLWIFEKRKNPYFGAKDNTQERLNCIITEAIHGE